MTTRAPVPNRAAAALPPLEDGTRNLQGYGIVNDFNLLPEPAGTPDRPLQHAMRQSDQRARALMHRGTQ